MTLFGESVEQFWVCICVGLFQCWDEDYCVICAAGVCMLNCVYFGSGYSYHKNRTDFSLIGYHIFECMGLPRLEAHL